MRSTVCVVPAGSVADVILWEFVLLLPLFCRFLVAEEGKEFLRPALRKEITNI
jgi:hypothetical protein